MKRSEIKGSVENRQPSRGNQRKKVAWRGDEGYKTKTREMGA